MINKILIALGLRKDVGAPVHAGKSPVYFTYVYEDESEWFFSWHDAAHQKGTISAPFWSKEAAESARDLWEFTMSKTSRAMFVRP